MTEQTLPYNPEEQEPRYTKADAAEDPVRKEAAAATAQKEMPKAEENRIREERILDMPIPIRVGEDTFQFTSRPMGFVKMALREFLSISGTIVDIQEGMSKMVEIDDEEKGEDAVSYDDIRNLLLEKGDEASTSMYKIVQILLEPVTGGPPNFSAPTVSLEKIEWEMEVSEIAFLFSKFLERDIFTLGSAVKNLIGFSQRT